MNRPLSTLAAAVALTAACAVPPAFAAVGVSIGVREPGVYGRIDIGSMPPPVVLPQPVLVVPGRRIVERSPIYLYVPDAEQRQWRHYCARYAACNQPVYFVREEWVRERWRAEHPGWDRGRHRGWDRHRDDDRRGGGDRDERHGRGHDRRG